MGIAKLTEAERADRLPALEGRGWALVDGRDAIHKVSLNLNPEQGRRERRARREREGGGRRTGNGVRAACRICSGSAS